MYKRYILLSIVVLYFIIAVSLLRGEVPGLINYQGKLTDDLGIPVNAELEMGFALYTEVSGGWAIWSESQDVTVTDGVFNVLLGKASPLGTDNISPYPSIYLGVRVGEDPEMLPRQEIASAAYALKAGTADRLTDSGRLQILEAVYPVGAVYLSTLSANPADILGFGTWATFGAGRVLVGYDEGDSNFNAGEKTGGAKSFNNSHYHNASDLRAAIGAVNDHPGSIGYRAGGAIPGVSYTYAITGGNISISHINHSTPVYGTTDTQQSSSQSLLQPYITVHIWKRTG